MAVLTSLSAVESAPGSRLDLAAADSAARLERVMAFLAAADGAACDLCGTPLCGHTALMSLAAGHEDAPLCLSCLAEEVGRAPENLRDELAGFILRKDCFSKAWGVATAREGFTPPAPPRCLWPGAAPQTASAPAAAPPAEATAGGPPPSASARWDAGDMACGELVLELRLRLASLAAGEVLLLTARDPGAVEDLPAWCRLTGNALVAMRSPEYWIRRRRS
jgi:tRNA 2-thiouridine synthesizing protein A